MAMDPPLRTPAFILKFTLFGKDYSFSLYWERPWLTWLNSLQAGVTNQDDLALLADRGSVSTGGLQSPEGALILERRAQIEDFTEKALALIPQKDAAVGLLLEFIQLLSQAGRPSCRADHEVLQLLCPPQPRWFPDTQVKGARVFNSANQSCLDNAVNTLSWDSEDWDVGGWHNPAVNPARLTVPNGYKGKVLVMGQAAFDAIAGGTQERIIYIQKNGGTIAFRTQTGLGAIDDCVMGLAVEDQAVPGDYYEIKVFHNTGVNIDVLKDEAFSHASIAWLGT